MDKIDFSLNRSDIKLKRQNILKESDKKGKNNISAIENHLF